MHADLEDDDIDPPLLRQKEGETPKTCHENDSKQQQQTSTQRKDGSEIQ